MSSFIDKVLRQQTVKTLLALVLLTIFLLFANTLQARVYVYEVKTATNTFTTASKLQPDAFLYYNGGFDVIYSLKILAIYKDKDMAQAMRDFNLEKNNSNQFNHIKPDNHSIPKKPYYWWR